VKKFDYELYPSFTVAPLRSQLNLNDQSMLLKVSDLLLKGKASDKLDHSNHLVGEIKNGKQLFIPNKILSTQFIDWIKTLSMAYVNNLSGGSHTIEEEMSTYFWIVSQLENDYNPLHNHTGTISGIIYLKVPEQINLNNHPDGYISFTHSRYDPDKLSFLGPKSVLPKVGDIYLFPSWLSHQVYPFSGVGERRSISFNIKCKIAAVPK
jgi:hypothetical protein